MKYSILVYETEDQMKARTDPARQAQYWAAYKAYTKALTDAGVFAGGAGLEAPAQATTIRMRADKRQVQDGPFADSKEILGGMYIIEVPDLDKALEWAARCPSAATGSAEVRPNLSMAPVEPSTR